MTVLFEGDLPIDKVMVFKVDGEQQFIRVEQVDMDLSIAASHCGICILHGQQDWASNGRNVTRGDTTVQFANDKRHHCHLGTCMPGERTDGNIVRYVKIE